MGMGVVMNTNTGRLIWAALAFGVMTAPAAALPARLGLGVTSDLPSAGHLTEGGYTAPPAAFVEYCGKYSSQCTMSGSGVVELDASRWAQLRDVQYSVNARITSKVEAKGEDHWDVGVSAGDCDDYAVTKRAELIDRGWPSSALTLTVGFLPNGEGHLVLVARTDRGEFLLDNLRSDVVAADRVHYRWVARQSSVHPKLWVRVNGAKHDDLLLAKVRRDRDDARNQTTPAAFVSSRPEKSEVTGQIAKPAAPSSAASTLDAFLLNR